MGNCESLGDIKLTNQEWKLYLNKSYESTKQFIEENVGDVRLGKRQRKGTILTLASLYLLNDYRQKKDLEPITKMEFSIEDMAWIETLFKDRLKDKWNKLIKGDKK